VRIFLGTEPRQQRAERVFVWSVERVRDPSRVYEIHLMKDLAGFARRGWTTGFTNYRFAIPHFAGGRGRAIYNDVDQVYLTDPAELFDLEMQGHGFLAIAPHDPSVRLIYCARMAQVWRLEDARRQHKSKLIARAHADPDLCGRLAPEWNARDDELAAGTEKLIHFTTLHMQPWRPFPERFVYQSNPRGHVWFDLERSADAAGYQVYSRERPSPGYAAWLETSARGVGAPAPASPGTRRYTPPAPGAPAVAPVDALVCGGALADLPAEDLPWVLDDLMAGARRSVSLELPWDGARRSAERWEELVARAGNAHPEVRWSLTLRAPDGRSEQREGGARSEEGPPRVWVLADDRPGNATQSQGLAEALGWPWDLKRLHCRAASRLHNRLLGARRIGIDPRRSSPLEPPWPDLVIAAGRRTAPVARWIRARSGGRTRIVMLGRKGGDAADLFDLVVTPTYARLYPHPHRLETTAPLHRVTEAGLAAARERWAAALSALSAPRIAVLVGGTSGQYRVDAKTARRIGEGAMAMARACGGSIMATTSRRLSRDATLAFCDAVEGAAFVHRWSADATENPYLGLLAWADAFVITGDSESMLAEAASLGKPCYIHPLPVRTSFRLLRFLRDQVWRRGRGTPSGPRGTPRPQRGLERLCARLVDRGWVRPSRDLDRLHATLVERGAARPFGEPYDPAHGCAPLSDRDVVVTRVRDMMGVPARETTSH
jgi:mitochondrial fission protein ELM1